jgi:hypothetical protein
MIAIDACTNCLGFGALDGGECPVCEGSGKEPVCAACDLILSLDEVQRSRRHGGTRLCAVCAPTPQRADAIHERLRGPVRAYPPEAPTEPTITYRDDPPESDDEVLIATGGGR